MLLPFLTEQELSTVHPEQIQIAPRVGPTLETLLYRPSQRGPLPTILIRQPVASGDRGVILEQIAREFVKYGFAVVLQQISGRSQAGPEATGGEQPPTAAFDTIEWITKADWSNGSVGTWDESEDALWQWAQPTQQHPAHLAMVLSVAPCETGAMKAGVQDSDGLDKLKLPALHRVAFFDPHRMDHFAVWERLDAGQAGAHQFLRASASDAQGYRFGESRPALRDFRSDPFARQEHVARILAEPVSFFRHYLSGRVDPWKAPKVRYEVARNGWRVADSWPPSGTRRVDFDCRASEVVLPGEQHSVDVSMSPVQGPDQVTLNNPLRFEAPSPDDEVFKSSPLSRDLLLVGSLKLRVEGFQASRDATLEAQLLEVSPDGQSSQISEGRGTRQEPGADVLLVVLGDAAYRVPRGHHLRVMLRSKSYDLSSEAPEHVRVHAASLLASVTGVYQGT